MAPSKPRSLDDVLRAGLAAGAHRPAPSIDMYLDKSNSDLLQRLFNRPFAADVIYDREHSTLTLSQWADAVKKNEIIDIGSYGLFRYTNLPSYDGDPAINEVAFGGFVDKRTIERFASTGVVKSFRVMALPFYGGYSGTYSRTMSNAPLLPAGEKKYKVSYSSYALHDISKILEETYDPVENETIFMKEDGGGVQSGARMPKKYVDMLGERL